MKLHPISTCALALAMLAAPLAAQTVSYPAPVNLPMAGGPGGVAKADFDNDGDVDLAFTHLATNSVSIHLNDGAGNFAFAGSFATPSAATKIKTRDLDLNGSDDIIVLCGATSQITVALNAGNAVFLPPTSTLSGADAVDYDIGDLNGDGFPDMVVCNFSIGSLSVLLNNGTGAFQFFGTNFAISGPTAVAFGDVDSDGDEDIVATSGTFSAVALIRNDTTTFTPVNFWATGFFPLDVMVVDVDHDQRPDIVTCNVGSSDVSVLKNMVVNGNYAFAAPVNTFAGDAPISITTTNADNWLGVDLVVNAWNGQQMRVLGNNGSGGFTHLITRYTQPNPIAVVSADFDGDLDDDLISANVFANSYTYIQNLAPAIPYPGTGDDIAVSTGINGAPLTDGVGFHVKPAVAGDTVVVAMESPNGLWNNDHAVLGVQVYYPNFPPIPPLPGIWLNEFGFGVIIALDTPALNPLGESISFNVPMGIENYSIMAQSLVLGVNAGNGIIGGSNAHEIRIVHP